MTVLTADMTTETTPEEQSALEHVGSIVSRSGTSFLGGMRILPRSRRLAMYAVYAFCREVDDIADGSTPLAEKRQALAEWRREVDRILKGEAVSLTGRALEKPTKRYDLERDAFLAVIDGMEMDAEAEIVAPPWQELELYCARVAGAVGRLSVRIFGDSSAGADEVARTLGEALQLTNILRDLAEDAERGRLYLPEEALATAAIETRDPAAVLEHPALGDACAPVIARAEQRFLDARTAMKGCPRRAMRPARVMMEVYYRVLQRLKRRGWSRPEVDVGLSRPAKILIALRYGLF